MVKIEKTVMNCDIQFGCLIFFTENVFLKRVLHLTLHFHEFDLNIKRFSMFVLKLPTFR